MQYYKDKFINALLFFAENTNPKIFGVTKLMKLLFYADFLHYKKYGRPIIGDEYLKYPQGPVPHTSYNLVKEYKENELNKIIEIKREQVGDYIRDRIIPKSKSNLKVFSKSDIEIMGTIAKEFCNTTGSKLAGYTHGLPFVINTDELLPIDYNNIIKDEEDKEYLIYLKNAYEQIEAALLA